MFSSIDSCLLAEHFWPQVAHLAGHISRQIRTACSGAGGFGIGRHRGRKSSTCPR